MKKIVAACALIITAFTAFGQTGQEWINFNQSYYKIPVAKNGIYRLSYLDLQNAGVPVGSIDPQTIQIFHRGIEQAIYIEGEADAQLNPVDFIEFYGKENDGTLDAELYKPSSLQPHSYYNLYNDTTCYFLTYNAVPGKRMTTFDEPNSTGLPVEAFHTDEKLIVLKTQYATGLLSNDIQNAFFDEGEGWTGQQIAQNQLVDYTLTGLTQQSTSNGNPVLELLLVGRWTVLEQAEIYAGPDASSVRLLTTSSFNAFQTTTITQPLNWSDIASDGKLVIRIKAVGTGSRLSASYIKVRYPQAFDNAGAAEKVFRLPENPADKSYIEIANPSTNQRLFDISNPSDVIKIGTTQTSSLNAVVPSTSSSRTILATSATITPSIKAVRFRQIIPSQHDYIIISHKLLMRPAPGYADPVKAYGSYRASAAGGSYDTLVVDMDLLFDQFSYGETTPVSIFHFMKFLTQSHVPKYLLLVGKGLNITLGYYRNPVPFVYKDFVPSAGMPGSDILYTAGLAGSLYEPGVATGRIPASTPGEVAAYLNKVKESEALPFNTLWKKNLLHLSGGIEEGEPEKFKYYLEQFEDIAEGEYLGGKVTALAKRSREIEQNIDVSLGVNKGVGLITFFGHSSSSTLDFDVGFVTNPVLGYNNKGKYPIFLINGCNAGSFFLYGKIFGEDWINAEDKGALGFIAHTFYGFESNIRTYSQYFYEVAYGDSVFIQKGIGDIQKETARRFMDASSPHMNNITQAQQMILLGDPAVKLFGAKKPDYEINSNNLSVESLDGSPVTAVSESFSLKIIVQNFGQAKGDTFRIEVQRRFNDNTVNTYDSLFAPVLYSDTISFFIPKERNSGYGNNVFTVTLDPDNIINELDESNNTASLGSFIPLNSTKNLYPFKYAIVNTQQVNLSFQNTDVLSGERDFIIELDTINTFSSPFRKQFTVKGKVLAKQAVTLPADDSLAYYWRTKLVGTSPGDTTWDVSSFTFINQSPEGWAQGHFPQYLENAVSGLIKDPEIRELRFLETVSDVSLKTFGSNIPFPITDVKVKINGAEYNLVTQGFVCRSNTINLIAFDRRSTVPYIGIPFKWYNAGGRACGREPWVINSFASAELVTGNNDDIVAYVNNIAVGDSVLIYSVGNANYAAWPMTAKVKLGELGISVAQIDGLLPGEPVVIFGRKGLAPGSALLIRSPDAPADQQSLLVSKTITGRYSSGEMTSTTIGPAMSWDKLVSKNSLLKGVDEASIDIIGIKLNGESTILFADIAGEVDLTSVDASVYQYLKLKFKTKDDVDLTAVQLDKWIVLYEPVAEGILLYDGNRDQQTLFEGTTWNGSYGFLNISDKIFSDSVLTVNFESFNSGSRTSDIKNFTIKAPAPGDTTKFAVMLNTNGKGGLNDVNVFVNRRILPELYYDNNVLELHDHLNVITDEFNPVLEVAIDGRQVSNGDFVSPDPSINIRLWDENKFVLKTDTTGMKILLTYPCEGDCEPERINFSSPDVVWSPATSTSDFAVLFTPKDLPEGKYTLRVEASDARGNSSGAVAYEVTFNVTYESSIIIDQPFPNPTPASSTFRIVVSGKEVPQDFSLRIISTTGSTVRIMDSNSIQPFFIGSNEIVWNGKDDRNNALSSGIYIYTLKLNFDGKEVVKTGKIALTN